MKSFTCVGAIAGTVDSCSTSSFTSPMLISDVAGTGCKPECPTVAIAAATERLWSVGNGKGAVVGLPGRTNGKTAKNHFAGTDGNISPDPSTWTSGLYKPLRWVRDS